jgi:carbonic anhydrase
MEKIVPITKGEDIYPEYQNTPIGRLLEYHNLGRQFETYDSAQLLIGTCMDNRISLQLPDKYAYIIRTGGGNIKHNEFHISYAIAVGQVEYIVLIGHNKCGMSNLAERKEKFVSGLVERAGWTKEMAEEHYSQEVSACEIGNEIDYLVSDVKRLRSRYPRIKVVPLMYLVEDNLLYQVKEE